MYRAEISKYADNVKQQDNCILVFYSQCKVKVTKNY
jgi:hypothetical protein